MYSVSLVDIPNIAFASSLATDKIVGVYSGSFNTDTAPQFGSPGYIAYTSFPHTFTRPVFTKLQTSTDQTNWKDENTSTVFAISYSTSSQIFVLHMPGNGVIYYRVIAFWIDDYDGTNPSVPPTVGSKSNIYFDSRLNYQKVAQSGVLTIPAGTLNQTDTIIHSLGYEPNVRVFAEAYPGEVWPATYGGLSFNYWDYTFTMLQVEVEIYNNTLVLKSGGAVSTPASRVWYRIYYDG